MKTELTKMSQLCCTLAEALNDAPDDGQLERWRTLATRLRHLYGSEAREAAFQLENAYLYGRKLRAAIDAAQQAAGEQTLPAPAEGDGPFPAPDLRGIDGATYSEWRMLELPAKSVLIQEKDLPEIIKRACLAYAAAHPKPKVPQPLPVRPHSEEQAMKIKTSELQGAALDWVVAKCEGRIKGDITHPQFCRLWKRGGAYYPSTNWAQGGPIIEREKLTVALCHPRPAWASRDTWAANENLTTERPGQMHYGPSPLIAAMRCYVASKLGEEVEVPAELL